MDDVSPRLEMAESDTAAQKMANDEASDDNSRVVEVAGGEDTLPTVLCSFVDGVWPLPSDVGDPLLQRLRAASCEAAPASDAQNFGRDCRWTKQAAAPRHPHHLVDLYLPNMVLRSIDVGCRNHFSSYVLGSCLRIPSLVLCLLGCSICRRSINCYILHFHHSYLCNFCSHDCYRKEEKLSTSAYRVGVFTELLQQLQLKGLHIDELYSLDLDALKDLQPIDGLILLYKWRPPEKDERPVIKDAVPNVFFANQIINSACATQAIVSVLLNSSGITLSEDLKKLKEFAKDMKISFIAMMLIKDSPNPIDGRSLI
ncbi:hypothetical protein ZWY2020_040449 [Hordeum vulgare]|nr:hypothetical protein ZWY2020_040449 [Hordeum vulgare]